MLEEKTTSVYKNIKNLLKDKEDTWTLLEAEEKILTERFARVNSISADAIEDFKRKQIQLAMKKIIFKKNQENTSKPSMHLDAITEKTAKSKSSTSLALK